MNSPEHYFDDYKLWEHHFKQHLNRKMWGKFYKMLYIHFKVVNIGMKPSFLWDIGPVPDKNQVKLLVSDLKSNQLLQSCMFILCIKREVFIVNKSCINEVLSNETYFKYVQLNSNISSNETSRNERSDLFELLQKIDTESNIAILASDAFDISTCIVKVFGIMLGYPTVFNSNISEKEPCLNFVPLVNIKVFIDISGTSHEIYSFTHVPQDNLSEHVDKWFSSLQLNFKKFHLTLYKKNVSFPHIVM